MNNKNIKAKLSAKELSMIAIFTAITAVFAQIAIPILLPQYLYPLVYCCLYVSYSIKPKHAVYSQICYLALGGLGVPVFGGFW